VPLQIIGGTGVGDEASSAYARANGHRARCVPGAVRRARCRPASSVTNLVAVLGRSRSTPRGFAFGLKGDTGITVLEGEAA